MGSKKIAVYALVCLLLSLPAESTGQETPSSPSTPPLLLSMVKSAVLPGFGEFGLNSVSRGRFFSEMELLLWFGLLESRAAVSLYTKRLHSFATVHSGTDLSGKGTQYLVNVGNYNNMDAYNESQQRRREPRGVYRDRDRFNWIWDSEDNRKRFRRFRIKRDSARKVGQFLVGAMVLNRIVSVIDVRFLYTVRKSMTNVSVRPTVHDDTLTPRVSIVWRF